MSIKAIGVTETSKWLGRIKSGIADAIKEEISGTETLSSMQAEAQQIVATVVYAAYDPKEYDRTFELISAVGAVQLQDDPPAAGICIELTPGVIANHGKGDISYAQFMLPDKAGKSWLATTAPGSIPRDFLTVWQQYFADKIPAQLSAAINRVLHA